MSLKCHERIAEFNPSSGFCIFLENDKTNMCQIFFSGFRRNDSFITTCIEKDFTWLIVEKNKLTIANVLSLLLPCFCSYFYFKLGSFLLVGHKNIFTPELKVIYSLNVRHWV